MIEVWYDDKDGHLTGQYRKTDSVRNRQTSSGCAQLVEEDA